MLDVYASIHGTELHLTEWTPPVFTSTGPFLGQRAGEPSFEQVTLSIEFAGMTEDVVFAQVRARLK